MLNQPLSACPASNSRCLGNFAKGSVLSLFLISSTQVTADVSITRNAIFRTFLIRWQDKTGTGFTIDHRQRQYLLTARHVVEGIKSGEFVEVFHENEWKSLLVTVVGTGKDGIDITVLACSTLLSPSYPLHTTTANLAYGQQVSILGYPFGWHVGGEEINRGIPLPLVKAGVVSAIESGDVNRIILDVHGNKGFSGAPVLFVPTGRPKNELSVAGIVSYYPVRLLPIVDRKGRAIKDNDGEPIAYVKENTGFLVAIGIRHALDLIEANPIGYQIELL